MITQIKERIAASSRKKRASLFRREFGDSPEALVVDLGGGKGRHMARYYGDLRNVCIADYNEDALKYARSTYNFRTRKIDGTAAFPFDDQEVDIIFCSSVIEHVTGPKDEAVNQFKRDGRRFRRDAWRFQQQFAEEIRRSSKRYFVQTPYRFFPVEVHSWIPFLGFLPTHLQWKIIRIFNNFWPRRDECPDWSLLTFSEMEELFPDAKLEVERLWIFPKSIIAIR